MFIRNLAQSLFSFQPQFHINASQLLDRRFDGYRCKPFIFSLCTPAGTKNLFEIQGDGFKLTYAAGDRKLDIRESRGEDVYTLWIGKIPDDSDPVDFIQELLTVNRGYLGPKNLRHFISALTELEKELNFLRARGSAA